MYVCKPTDIVAFSILLTANIVFNESFMKPLTFNMKITKTQIMEIKTINIDIFKPSGLYFRINIKPKVSKSIGHEILF